MKKKKEKTKGKTTKKKNNNNKRKKEKKLNGRNLHETHLVAAASPTLMQNRSAEEQNPLPP